MNLFTEKCRQYIIDKHFIILSFLLINLTLCCITINAQTKDNDFIFYEDFESGLDKWILSGNSSFKLKSTSDLKHANVLEMIPGGEFVQALIKNSDQWSKYRVEADFLFPENEHNYMGFIYNFNQTGQRIDFGSIYVKGNGSYIRINPHRDYNVQRTLYEEYKTPLTGKDSIKTGEWYHMKAEVIDSICHFYIGGMDVPKITFDLFEFKRGNTGFKPRVIGGSVWIDNVSVKLIKEFSYKGTRKPDNITYKPEELITDWKVIGPFYGTMPELEQEGFIEGKVYSEEGKDYYWKDFKTDKRGCIVSGSLTEFTGGHNIAYFYTTINSEVEEDVNLHVSSNESLAHWLNGEFLGYDNPLRYAWYDFWENPKHKGNSGPIHLKAGDNSLLIRVRGGKYAGGGFFVRIEKLKNN